MHFPRSDKVRGLVDCDSFFASCEIYAHPHLQGKPVCVGRQIIVAASYLAKSYGAKTGMPIREAKKILPDNTVFCSPNFPLYNNISQQLIRFLATQCTGVYPASIDEAFIDLTDKATDQQGYLAYAEQLKHSIKAKVGIPVSIGVAPTKLLAKLGAGKNKPFGSLVMLEEDTISRILTDTKLQEVSFIGKRTLPKLTHLCSNAEQFRQLDYHTVKQLLGHSGIKIRGELNCSTTNIRKERSHPKSISRTRSFSPHFTNTPTTLRRHLMGNIEQAYRQLLTDGLQTKGIKVMLRTKSCSYKTAKLQLPLHTNDKKVLIHHCKQLFTGLPTRSELYRSTGVYFFSLQPQRSKAISLFTTQKEQTAKQQLQQLIKQINKKWDKPVIRAASARQQRRTPELPTLEVS